MRKYTKTRLLMAILSICAILSGCGKSSLYDNHENGYTTVTSIKGISFDVFTSLLETATAITTISPDGEYSGNTFLYKDGESEYLIFNMNSIVLVAEKGTEFDFVNTKDYETALTSTDVNGVWFSPDDRNLEYKDGTKKGIYKFIATVKADISVTPTLYGTFVGQLASMNIEGTEYSLFIGAKGDRYKSLTGNQKDIIEHVVKSMTKCDYSEENSGKIIQELEVPSDSVSANEPSEKGQLDVKSNQRKYVGMESDIYHMLSIGDSGSYEALRNDGSGMEKGVITINNLFAGEDAINIIKRYCNTSESPYAYSDAPDGYSWHVVKYTTTLSPADIYTDIRMEGLDGEKLKYRGVAHNKRTHDIFAYEKENSGKYTELYCYYAVPNGCTEYMLECGTFGDVETDTACFYVGGFRKKPQVKVEDEETTEEETDKIEEK